MRGLELAFSLYETLLFRRTSPLGENAHTIAPCILRARDAARSRT